MLHGPGTFWTGPGSGRTGPARSGWWSANPALLILMYVCLQDDSDSAILACIFRRLCSRKRPWCFLHNIIYICLRRCVRCVFLSTLLQSKVSWTSYKISLLRSLFRNEIWIYCILDMSAVLVGTQSLHVWFSPLGVNNCFWAAHIEEVADWRLLHNQLVQSQTQLRFSRHY